MKKTGILALGIVAIFIGMAFISVSAEPNVIEKTDSSRTYRIYLWLEDFEIKEESSGSTAFMKVRFGIGFGKNVKIYRNEQLIHPLEHVKTHFGNFIILRYSFE
jgi:hypothetical protein